MRSVFGRKCSCDTSGTSSATPQVFSPLYRTLRTQLRQGVGKQVRHGLLGVCSATGMIPATPLKLRESAATLSARHCVARLGSRHVCATKPFKVKGMSEVLRSFRHMLRREVYAEKGSLQKEQGKPLSHF